MGHPRTEPVALTPWEQWCRRSGVSNPLIDDARDKGWTLPAYARARVAGATHDQFAAAMDAGIPAFGYAWCRYLGLDHDAVCVLGPKAPLNDLAKALRAGCELDQLCAGIAAGIRPNVLTMTITDGVTITEALDAARTAAVTQRDPRWHELEPYIVLRRAGATHVVALEVLAQGVDPEEYALGLRNGVEHCELMRLPRGSVAAFLAARDQGMDPVKFRLLYTAGLTTASQGAWGLAYDVEVLLGVELTPLLAEYIAGLAPTWTGRAEDLAESISTLLEAEDRYQSPVLSKGLPGS